MKRTSNSLATPIMKILFWLLILAGATIVFFRLILRLPNEIPIVNSENSTTTDGSSILLYEDFEDGIAQDFFVVSGNWKIISDNDNKVWDIDNSSGSNYAGVNFSEEIMGQNYTIQYRVKMMNFVSQATPETILYFRVDDKGNKNVQAFTPDYNGSKLITFGKTTNNAGWEEISTQVHPFATEKWYTIQIIAKDNEFKIYVDNKLVINSNDSQVTSGRITLQVGPGAHVRFDNIFVSNN